MRQVFNILDMNTYKYLVSLISKKNNKSIIIWVITLIIIFLPIYLWWKYYLICKKSLINSTILSSFESFQNLVVDFWSLILNIILVCIAYKAFKNFDVKKQFHNKQLDIVSELAALISSMEFYLNLYTLTPKESSDNPHSLYGVNTSFFDITVGYNTSKYELICIRGNNLENTLPFLKFRYHPLLPKSIADDLKNLCKEFNRVENDELNTKNYVLLENTKRQYKKEPTGHIKYTFYETTSNLKKDISNLRKSIMDWYEKYGADNLNI